MLYRTHLIILYVLLAVLFAVVLLPKFTDSTQEAQGEEVIVESADGEQIKIIFPEPKVRLFSIPEEASFAGEKAPLDQADLIERFEREIYVNAYWQSNMIMLMKRASKFLPEIEKILAEHNVPDDFKYLAIAESGLMNVASPAGAKGFWQFMEATAKEYNLEVNKDVDERYHLEKSTIAACKYLKYAHARFGNWTSVAASYNMGMSGLRRRKDEQRFSDYYNLMLNEETSRYVFRILAIKDIFENPQKYGYELSDDHFYKPARYKSVTVDQTIKNLPDWAIAHGSSYKQLKLHNPWLRSDNLPVKKGQQYVINLPL